MITRIFIFLIAGLNLSSVAEAQSAVKWMSLEEAVERSKTEKRKIFIDIYTDWCGWCKVMEKETFQNPCIANYLNRNYYPVKFNAEQKKDIVFKGTVYSYVKTGNGGYHSLAAAIMRGKLSYPTSVFLDENLNLIQPLDGYLNIREFEKVMVYFAQDRYRTTPWPKYERTFESPVNCK